MEPTAQRILDLESEPAALEALYRADRAAFRAAFDDALAAAPESTTLRVWKARLDQRAPPRARFARDLKPAIIIALAAGLLVRLPAIVAREGWFYPRFAPTVVILSVAAYFWRRGRDRQALYAGIAIAAAVLTFAAAMPGEGDSVELALMHLPVLAFGCLGYAFAGASWREPGARIAFIRYCGDLLVLGVLVGLAGLVFSGLTVGLFSMLTKRAPEIYFRNVGVVGASAVPVAATYLYDNVFNRRTGIAPVLARSFAPLFLVMTAAYLAFALLGGKNPFTNREFLAALDALLLVVLGMTVLSIAERGEQTRAGWTDYVNLALLALTLAMSGIGLAAISFRLGTYGFTPNRVVLMGATLVVMVHMAWMFAASLGFARGTHSAGDVARSVTGYLPVYLAWSAVVGFGLPLLFSFA